MSSSPMERRKFLRLAGWAAGAAALRPSIVLADPAPSAIDNVLVMPSVRNGQLTLRIDYHLATPEAGAKFSVQVTELNGSTTGLPSGLVNLTQTGIGTWRQDVVLPWTQPHLWDVGAAYLYLVNVQINRTIGGPLVYPTVRFGFREVWRDGKNMMLNDHPLKLRQVPFIGNVPQMHFYSGMGMNAIEFQPNQGTWGSYPPVPFPAGPAAIGTLEMFDFADENGWIIFMPTISVSLYKNPDGTLDPTQGNLWMSQVRMANKDWDKQNRPSIISWVPVMNEVSNKGNPRHTNDPEAIGRELLASQTPQWATETMRLLKLEDPSRLVVFHEAGSSSDVHFGNVYLNAIPLQEREDHLSKWAQDGTLPYGSAEFGPPTTAPMFKYRFDADATSDGIPYFTEFFAEYLGDGAYTAENNTFVTDVLAARADSGAAAFAWGESFQKVGGIDRLGETTAYYTYIDLFIRNTNKSWRGWGANAGWHPWIQDVGFGKEPGWTHKTNRWVANNLNSLTTGGAELQQRPSWANAVYDSYKATLKPLLVFLAGPSTHFTQKDHHYQSGETAQRTIVAIWDGPGTRSVTADWKLMNGATQVASGTQSFTLSAGTVDRRAISVAMPTVTTKTNLTLELTATATGPSETITDVAAVTVFPAAAAGSLSSTWRIYDPVGKTTAELAAIGVSVISIGVNGSLAGVDVLIVGAQALDDSVQLPATAADIEGGLRVVMFEQSAEALQSMGLRTDDIMPRYAFTRVSDHPVLAGIDAANLINWRGSSRLLGDKRPTTTIPLTGGGTVAGEANSWPYPATRMHWGNRGSVASVVIETPHQGGFTPILESSFDLSFSPLVEWRHGTGNVLFCQLDVTDRTTDDPAAQRLLANIVDYLDNGAPTGPNAERGVAFVGTDADDQALLDDIGFEYRVASPSNLALQTGEVVVIGRGAVAGLSTTARNALQSHVQAGNTVIFLPRTATELASTSWPWSVTTQHQSLARVTVSGSSSLIRGIGPNLVHWRSFQELDVIASGGLPTGSDRLLDGLVGRVPDSTGQWVVAQFDWRGLTSGGNNTRRPRWNARKFYRQLLTNVGAVSTGSVAEGLVPANGRAPMTVFGPWRGITGDLLTAAPTPSSGGYHFNVYPNMDTKFRASTWPGTTGNWGTIITPDADGYVDLAPIVPQGSARGPAAGRTAYARTYIHSTTVRTATFSFGPGYWGALKVNGQMIVDDSVDGNTLPTAGVHPPSRVAATLQAGWNRIEVAVCTVLVPESYQYSPAHRLGFFIQTENPGDLVVDAAASDPTAPPPNPGTVQYSAAPIDLYMEPKPRAEASYRFNVY